MNGPNELEAAPAGTGAAVPLVRAKTDTPVAIDTHVELATPNGGPVVPSTADRMISGIDLIDGGAGGLIPNHVYLVKGATGIGKSTFGLQFLTRGLEHQEPGILITDRRPEKVIAHAQSIGFPIAEAVRRNQLLILNPTGHYFDLVESPADVMAIVEELSDYIRNVGARRLVIDPIYTLINTAYSSHFALTITQSLINALEDVNATTVLIAGDESDAETNGVVRALEQNASGVVSLDADPATGGRVMRLTKFRQSGSALAAHYRILNGRGIINYDGTGEKVADVTKPWDETPSASHKVLILGAQPETVARVKEALGTDFTVEAESDLRAGIDRVKRENPGLVLVTPSRAAEAVRAILDLAQHSTSSVAFLSPANNRQPDKVLYLRAGADDFIAEPFTPAELRARVDALIRRSGRRLKIRDDSIFTLSADELSALMRAGEPEPREKRPVIKLNGGAAALDPEFAERLQRNVDTVAKFDQPFALYWIKADEREKDLNKSIAKLCRQEDIVCHNRNGEFVAILTGADESGLKGFETRLNEKLGAKLNANSVRRGHALYKPGDETSDFASRALKQ